MELLKGWRRRRNGHSEHVAGSDSQPMAESLWAGVIGRAPLFEHLEPAALAGLKAMAGQFAAGKTFLGKGDLEVDDSVRLLIAAQACLPVLNLGLKYYNDWRTVIVYPQSFVVPQEFRDGAGVVHRHAGPLVGEAWERGPLVLSWEDVLSHGDGFNVVIHECAHKLDMLNGAANGFPPLHAAMDAAWWSRVWSAAYEHHCALLEAGDETPLDPYAGENPGEFFAVASEGFFELPQLLQAAYPHVYRQLAAFYRQDPLTAAARATSMRTTPF